jgi:hypothetical protein
MFRGPAATGRTMTGAACLLTLALARSFPAVRARFSAVERGFYLAAIAWFAVFSGACATGGS